MHKFPLIGSDKGDLIQGNNKNPPKRLFPQSSISQSLIPELLNAQYFYKCARIALPISTMWIIHSCRSLSGLCKRHRSNGTPKYLALSVGVEPTVHCNLREEAKAHTPPVAKGKCRLSELSDHTHALCILSIRNNPSACRGFGLSSHVTLGKL